jgi:preprotein translocase subunit SecY
VRCSGAGGSAVPGHAYPAFMTSFSFMSTGLLIVVGVVIDTMRQLEAQLLMRHYEGIF